MLTSAAPWVLACTTQLLSGEEKKDLLSWVCCVNCTRRNYRKFVARVGSLGRRREVEGGEETGTADVESWSCKRRQGGVISPRRGREAVL